VAFVADDVAAAFQKAVEVGATGYIAPHQKAWDQTVAYVRDANGFLVELCGAIGDEL
jgi:uncharacterized glyoxalase superfamily protein PhnB